MHNDSRTHCRVASSRVKAWLTNSDRLGVLDETLTDLDIWTHVVGSLDRNPDSGLSPPATTSTKRLAARSRSEQIHHAHIEVIERLTDRTVAIRWQDATRCHYADQVWISGRARRTGRCAMTGAAISREDMVYRPRGNRAPPGNADAMILASAIANAPSRPTDEHKRPLTSGAPNVRVGRE